MAEIVRRRSWGGVLPLGRHASISGCSLIHCASVSIAPSLFQERQNARIQKRFKLEQTLALSSSARLISPLRAVDKIQRTTKQFSQGKYLQIHHFIRVPA